MHIKDIIVDGFKSYAQRTEIKNFDPQFNAITGLNGSGKSNILDSICFVLGITNLSQVRVNSLQELIYKNAQSGITKATVCVIFDNICKSQSPIGYENSDEIIITRQIIAGGKHKYLINGYNATNARVNDLFRSVNLNVNNPHFLIMQGRITKVLNMKPPEILSLIEETVGTKLYDSKRNAALKVIEKKDAKLEEIHKVIKDEIMPLLEKLNKDKSSFLDYQKVTQDLEHFGKIFTAYLYWDSSGTISNLNQKQEEFTNKIQEDTDIIKEKDEAIGIVDGQIRELEAKLGKEKGFKEEKIEKALSEAQREESKTNTILMNAIENLQTEQRKIQEVESAIAEEEGLIETKTRSGKDMGGPMEKLEYEFAHIQTSYKAAQQKLQACSTGLCVTGEDGISASLTQQLINCQTALSELETEKEQIEMTLTHAQGILGNNQEKGKANRKSGDKMAGKSMGPDMEYKTNLANLQSLQKTITSLQAEASSLSGGVKPEDEMVLAQGESIERNVRLIQNELCTLEDACPSLRFGWGEEGAFAPPLTPSYPASPFCAPDASKIKGPVISTITGLLDEKYVKALEVTAGGKVHFVIVDNEQVGKTLLQKGNLKRRTTFIPLNKISAKGFRPQIVKLAVEIGGGRNKIRPALEVVKFNENVRPAMEFVFGNTFLCEDMETAKKVTFHPDIQQRCVTLEGDIFEPSGTISGGYHNPSAFSPLNKCLEILAVKERLKDVINQRTSIEPQLERIKQQRARSQEIIRLLELKTHEADLLDFKIKNNPYHQAQQDVENTKKLICEEQEKMKNVEERIKRIRGEIKDLEGKMKNAESYQDAQTLAAKVEVEKIKAKYDTVEEKLKNMKLNSDKLSLDLEEMRRNLVALRLQKEGMVAQALKSEEYVHRFTADLETSKLKTEKISEELKAHKEAMRVDSREITAKQNQKKSLLNLKNESQLQLQKLNQTLHTIRNNIQHCEDKLAQLAREHKWIKEECLYFGKPNTIYEFSKLDMGTMENKLKEMREEKQRLSRVVNSKALVMLEHVEERYKELINKKVTLLADKRKIEEVIKQLDEKKSTTLHKAHEQVNKDFGSIFSTLLPGAASKIVAPEGQTIMQGLEIKVSFNNVWKESLGELSGGQRSLIALALILSLLLFKPAPIYILDEIDAALDASHTQNIGIMLSQHFKTSQFIVVSLKDGMFQNANVLFKTALVEGKSTVSRYTRQPPK